MTANQDDGKDQVLALLCGDAYPWTWGSTEASCQFTFRDDGKGTISCGENQHDWFALEMSWAFKGNPEKVDNNTWKFVIEMALNTRIASYYHAHNPWLTGDALQDHLENPPLPSTAPFPWAPLHSAAFCPKQYLLTLSHGRFIEPFHQFIKKPYPLFQFGEFGSNHFAPNRYASQLTFDVSPYPLREEWAESWGTGGLSPSLDYHQHWEKKRFVRDAIAKKDETWAEMLDFGWWLSPTLGDAYKRDRT
ncbi:hypothetical protein OPT61_g4613 [Boeremia exigua]|uniref:Uncharacterized protein n=1 Tax=Boeremia exigua TaxID=749465 RepID=A0ACC2IDH2_9PLEO|nr:hypothetical protein OPT61_g4613 [Boeremia exigua]